MARKERCIIFQKAKKNQNFNAKETLKSCRSNDRFKLHNHETGQVCGSRFKTFDKEAEAADNEFDDTLRKEELFDYENCIWLSSGHVSSSPSSSYQYDGLFGCTDLKIDAWLISLLSKTSTKPGVVLSTQVLFFDGSKVNPMEEACLVLDQRKLEQLEEEEDVSWLVTTTENESSDSLSAACSERETESSSYGHYFVKWASKKRSELESDVANPVSIDEYSLCSSSFNSDYYSEVMDLEEFDTDDKPLVWPSNWASEWGSGTKGDFFIMSPRKNLHKVSNANGNNDAKNKKSYLSRRRKPSKTTTKIVPFSSVDGFETLTQAKVAYESESTDHWISDKSSELASVCKSLQLSTSSIYSVSDIADENILLSQSSGSDHASQVEAYEDTRTKTPVFWPSSCASRWNSDTKRNDFVMSPRKNICKPDMDLEKGCSRRLEFSSKSKALTNCAKTVATEGAEVKGLTKKPMTRHKIVLEDLLLVDKLNGDVGIEQVVGLSEFDGNEGIESKFNKDEFCLI